MQKLINKLTSYRNWIGKTILWILGIIMVVSENYALILKGFLLTDKEIKIDISSYILISSFGLLFIIGGVYLNKFLEKFTSNGNKF